jgi:hypothetical protein
MERGGREIVALDFDRAESILGELPQIEMAVNVGSYRAESVAHVLVASEHG